MKIAIIGGTSGIGKRCAESLLQDGHDVIVGGRNNPGTLPWKKIDVTSEESVKDFFSTLSGLDGLVFSAGISRAKEEPEEFQLGGHDEILRVNVTGALLCIKHSLKLLKASKGSIVLIGSIAARKSSEFSSISYTISKAGLSSIVRQYSEQLAQDGVRINSVLPSMTHTSMLENILGAKKINEILKGIPLKRIAEVNDIVAPIKFLLSKESSYMTGIGLDVSGGQYLNG